jgi:hypothetical protein
MGMQAAAALKFANDATTSLSRIARSFMRFSTAAERIAQAMEDANHLESLRFERETQDRDRARGHELPIRFPADAID